MLISTSASRVGDGHNSGVALVNCDVTVIRHVTLITD